MDVSIIIVNYNTCKMTSECIDSIFEKTKNISFEVILVDNASQDNSKDYFSKDTRITYIYNKDNIGFGRANNVAIKYCTGRNILFLNSDTLLINNAIKILSDYLDCHENVGATGGNLYTMNMTPMHSYKRFTPISFELNALLANIPAKLLHGSNNVHNFTDKSLSVNMIVGADLMIRKSVLDNVGMFDPRFFMYCEETELCHRIRKAKYKIISVPQARIIHLEGASFSADRRIERIKMNRDSLKLYCQIHYGKFYAGLVDFVWHVTIWSRILSYSIVGSAKKHFWLKLNRVC